MRGHRLHNELIHGGSTYYLCLYFSAHPIFENLKQSIEALYKSRRTSYVPHRFSPEEALALWLLKDNIVKTRSILLHIYTKWANILMTKTEKISNENQSILDAIFKELDIANAIAGKKLLTSFVSLSREHPNILGLYWNLVSKRTGWNKLTAALEGSEKNSEIEKIIFEWILLRNEGAMRGFYSTVNYILESFHSSAKDLEDGVDWVFDKMNKGGE
jgi:hypothetical protein